jgi:23S rRNA (cytosine1962-C5)-methyltransferase
MKTIQLKPGKERSALRGHPWLFDTAIAKGRADPGETVRVVASDDRFLGWGAFSPTSKIRARIWSFEESERIDEGFLERRLRTAWAMRERLAIPSNAWRWVHGEADGLPGLIVDVYDDTLSAQFLSSGAERFKAAIAQGLLDISGRSRLYERSDSGVRQLEGLAPVKGWLRRPESDAGHTELVIQEHQMQLSLDVAEGHKTGYYLDQRDARHRLGQVVAQRGCRRVLNCYGYTGGFSVSALMGMQQQGLLDGDASVVTIDSSGPALARAEKNLALNGVACAQAQFWDADVNASLRRLIQEGKSFEAIVLDPPKFAPTAAHAERAARAYKDINRLAFKLLEPGGVLFTYSCSGGIGAELFHKIVASAGTDARVDGYITERFFAAPDHPMTLCFPEGEYLKGLMVIKK